MAVLITPQIPNFSDYLLDGLRTRYFEQACGVYLSTTLPIRILSSVDRR